MRIVTVDPVGPLPHDWRRTVESYSGLAGLLDQVEVAFGRESGLVEVSRADRFIATTWWTAHIAQRALRLLGRRRFLYLIQEYEPFTFPMGSYAALAERVLLAFRTPRCSRASCCATTSVATRSASTRDGAPHGDGASARFQNAITAIDAPTTGELAGRRRRRLLFYSRPEPHAARNMFEFGRSRAGMCASRVAPFGAAGTLHGIGTRRPGRADRARPGAAASTCCPATDQHAYAGVLRGHDVGLALMYTPHPSLVPIEMASAGMLTVTNSFENKTPERMSEISPT